jgi:hypothetical protein
MAAAQGGRGGEREALVEASRDLGEVTHPRPVRQCGAGPVGDQVIARPALGESGKGAARDEHLRAHSPPESLPTRVTSSSPSAAMRSSPIRPSTASGAIGTLWAPKGRSGTTTWKRSASASATPINIHTV